METTFGVRTSYKMGGHYTLYAQDVGFYHSLPNYNETFSDEKGHAAVPIPDIVSILSVVGTAVLSSSVLAAAIKTWLRSHRTKITITVTGSTKQVTFEGPRLKSSVSDIQALLNTLEHKEGTEELNVIAERKGKNAAMITESQYKMLHAPGRP